MSGNTDKNNIQTSGARMAGGKNKEIVSIFAHRMLTTKEKNRYIKGNLVINNLGDMDDNLNSFDKTEAVWVADWIEYLGDQITATQIRTNPMNFKKIIHNRREELKKLA
jgi:hypothetical protein